MSVNQLSKARVHVGALYVGNARSAGASETGAASPRDMIGFFDVVTTGTITPGAITAGGTYETTYSYAGSQPAGSALSPELAALPGDLCIVQYAPPTAEKGIIIQAWVSAAGTITILFTNASSGSITPTARAYNIFFFAINHD